MSGFFNGAKADAPYHFKEVSVADLSSLPQPKLRIIFAPLDVPDFDRKRGLEYLFQLYSVPRVFVTEREQGMTHSFGTNRGSDDSYTSWFHFMFKYINVQPDTECVPHIVNTQPITTVQTTVQSQADLSWIKAGFFLRWLPATGPNSHVTLICFGAPRELESRFKHLAQSPFWKAAVQDPFSLFAFVFDELFLETDRIVWAFTAVFRHVEKRTLEQANRLGPEISPEFVGMHNIAKHIIFLKEGSDAALLTLKEMRKHHTSLSRESSSPSEAWETTEQTLRYNEVLFQSTNLRLITLEKRMQNIINLVILQSGNPKRQQSHTERQRLDENDCSGDVIFPTDLNHSGKPPRKAVSLNI
ncbi:MAG: hypothetical protein M1816_004926 [Peltula sp. TS41687]|nr:MAG: hypothetical protein M1816_004926 [Peltula sp. TS41687]